MLDALLSAVQALGNVVDTPGSVARGLVSGNPSRALAGILDPSQRVYGSEITGDPYSGFAVDLALDPLNLLGGIGLLKGTRAAKLAKATNARNAAMRAAGGMPEEIARLTKIVDEAGNPLRTYHGTPEAFGSYDLARADPKALYGKGIYTTADPSVASTYASKGVGPSGEIYYPIAKPEEIGREMRAFYEAAEPLDYSRMTDDDWVKEATYWLNDDGYTEMPDTIRSMFGKRQAPMNVRMQYIDARKPFFPDKMVDPVEALRIKRAHGYKDATGKLMSEAIDPEEAKSIFGGLDVLGDDLLRSYGVSEGHLQRAGYDSIVHTGGKVSGGKPHQVVIALDPSQVYSPWVVPSDVPVRSQSPLLAALAGLNVARAGREVGYG